jgi:hypothetical protein
MERQRGHDWSPLPGEPIPIAQQTPGDIDILFQRMALFEIVRTLPKESLVYQWAYEELTENGAFQEITIYIT